MNITVLCENQVAHRHARVCRGEWGLSLLIDYQGKRLLLDTGHTDLYWKNAKGMKIDIQNTDYLVLSHYHWDHVGGIKYHRFSDKIPIIAHPDILKKVNASEKQLIMNDFVPNLSTDPLEIESGVFFLGEIPRVNSFEPGTYNDEPVWDDSALVFNTKAGAVVVSGCSHSGICNICERAKEVSGQKLLAVLGGFHLTIDDEKAVSGTLDYFKNQENVLLFPMHCVDFETLVRFKNQFNISKLSTGDQIELP